MIAPIICTSRRAQSAIEVENAVVGKLVRGQEDGGVGHFGRVSHSAERRIFEVRLLQFWLEIYKMYCILAKRDEDLWMRRNIAAVGRMMTMTMMGIQDLAGSDLLCHISLSTQPGSSAFTRIDRVAISRHKARVKPRGEEKDTH